LPTYNLVCILSSLLRIGQKAVKNRHPESGLAAFAHSNPSASMIILTQNCKLSLPTMMLKSAYPSSCPQIRRRKNSSL